jgi:hypothetical protein
MAPNAALEPYCSASIGIGDRLALERWLGRKEEAFTLLGGEAARHSALTRSTKACGSGNASHSRAVLTGFSWRGRRSADPPAGHLAVRVLKESLAERFECGLDAAPRGGAGHASRHYALRSRTMLV